MHQKVKLERDYTATKCRFVALRMSVAAITCKQVIEPVLYDGKEIECFTFLLEEDPRLEEKPKVTHPYTDIN